MTITEAETEDYSNNMKSQMNFNFTNDNIYIENLFNVQLFKLFCEVNKKIIEDMYIVNVDEHNIDAFIVIKHLFKDLGLPQYFLKINFFHDIKNKSFRLTSNKDLLFELPFSYSPKAVWMDFDIICQYKKITDHDFSISVIIEDILKDTDVYVKNIIKKLINTLFNNLKQNINNYTCG